MIRFLTSVLALAVAGVFAASSALAESLKIGSEGSCEVFQLRDKTGKGFEVDVIQALCSRMGKTCMQVSLSSEDLIAALEEGRVDAIILPLKRVEALDDGRLAHTTPYHCSMAHFIAPRARALEPDRDGLRGMKIGAVRDSPTSAWLDANVGDAAALRYYETLDEALGDLSGLRLDAVLGNSCALYAWARSPVGSLYERKGVPVIASEEMVFATRMKDRSLAKRFDSALTAVVDCYRYAKKAKGLPLLPPNPGPETKGSVR